MRVLYRKTICYFNRIMFFVLFRNNTIINITIFHEYIENHYKKSTNEIHRSIVGITKALSMYLYKN